MSVVKHKNFGIGNIVGRVEKENITYIIVEFPNGRECKFAIPESFEIGLVTAEGDLKDEIDRAIAERESLKNKIAQTTQSSCSTNASANGRRTSVRRTRTCVNINDSIAREFEDYLIRAGYKEETASGNPSTVMSYVKGIAKVLEEEGISWGSLKINITSIIPVYDVGGEKELIGAKSNSTVINALRRFEEFVNA